MSDGEPKSENELVSFVVFSYCQESFIRKAIQAAFDQTYSPLEIILSDDCSSDRTFEIMKEMSKDYKGPHKIRLNRNLDNLGLIGHVNLAFEMADGVLVIPAAGDDISLPNRAKILYEAFRETRPYLMATPHLEIDDQGNLRGGSHSREELVASHTTEQAAYGMRSIIGATAAWSKEMHDVFGAITEPGTYEDAAFYFRARLAGRFSYVREPLVKYRTGGISWQKGEEQAVRLKKLRLRIATWRQRRKDIRRYCDYLEGKLIDAEIATAPIIKRLEQLEKTSASQSS